MPMLVNRLPKVTEYVTNFGKSVVYAVVDDMKETTAPNISTFMEDNHELFRDIASAAKNYKRTMMMADRAIKRSKVYEAGQDLKKNLLDSIKTGKFYDKERQNFANDRAGGSMTDMSDMDADFDFGEDAFDMDDDADFDEDDAAEMKSASIISETVEVTSRAQSKIIAKSTEYLAETELANTRLLFTQGEKMHATLSNGLASVQSMLSQMHEFFNGPMMAHMSNSQQFYEKTQTQLDTLIGMVKESTEMQRNLYKKEADTYKESNMYKVGGYSTPNLAEYGKQVTKNLKDYLGPEFSILFGDDMGDGNMLLTLVANPLAFIPEFFAKAIVPRTIKATITSIDETVEGVFSNLMSRLNKMSDSTNPIMEFFGKVFGIQPSRKTSIDTGNYEKGAVPFDGITRKTIIDVIPGHLSRIEAAITGSSERLFDYTHGKWTTIDYAKEQRDKNERQKYYSAISSYKLEEYLRDLEKQNKESAKYMRDIADNLVKKIYEEGYFAPYQTFGFGDDKESAADHYGVFDKSTFNLLADLIMADKSRAKGISSRIFRDKEYEANRMRDLEAKGYDVDRAFYNNTYLNSRNERGTLTHTRTENFLLGTVDIHNYNIFDYLKEIRDILLGKGPSNAGEPTSDNPDTPPSLGSPPPSPSSNTNPPEPFNLTKYNQRWSDELLIAAHRASDNAEDKDDKVFLSKLLEAGSLGEKFKVVTEGINNLMRKPGLTVAGILDTADKRLYNMLFGDKDHVIDPEDDSKNTIHGFLDYLVFRTRQTFDKMNDWLDENILDPLKDKLGIETMGDFFNLLIQKLGLEGPVEAVKGFVDKYTDPVRERLKEKFGWGWGKFKDSVSNTYGRIPGAIENITNSINTETPQPTSSGSKSSKKKKNTQSSAADDDYTTEDEFDLDSDTEEILDEQIAQREKEKQQEADADFWAEAADSNDPYFARGGKITKRGLAVVSPGEKIIPVGGEHTQKAMLTEEKAFARRHGLLNRGLNFYATGTETQNTVDTNDYTPANTKNGMDNGNDERKQLEEVITNVTKEVMGDTDHKGVANVIASGLIGSGVSLITGLIGGPLLGGAVGAGFGVLQNSNTVQKMIFGEDIVDQQGTKIHREGLISKKVQDLVKKYAPSMTDFGIAGGLAGLFTPFGLVGGLMIGGALGFAKENEQVQNLIFGEKDPETNERDGGLLKKEFRDKLKKAAPRMLLGAAGVALFGPLGFLPNVVMGSALGFATTTNEFHEAIFGKETEDGKRYGGLIGQVKDGFVKPMLSYGAYIIEDGRQFIKKHVFSPLKDFGIAIRDAALNGIENVAHGIKDFLADMAERTIGRPLSEWFQHTILERITKIVLGFAKLPITAAKAAIAAPAHMLGWIGNNIRSSQIAKGSARGMTAEDRIKFRRKHFMRTSVQNFLGRDKSVGFDQMLTTMQGQEGIDKMKTMRDQIDDYLDNSKIGSKASKLLNKCGAEIRSYLETTTIEDKHGVEVPLYYFLGSGIVKLIKRNIATGKIKDAEDLMHIGKMMKVPYEKKEPLKQIINQYLPEINKAILERQQTMGNRKAARDALKRASGGFMRNRRSIRNARRYLQDQIDYREAQNTLKEEEKDPTIENISIFRESVEGRADRIIDALYAINKTLGGEDPRETKKAGESKTKPAAQVYLDDSDDTEDEFEFGDDGESTEATPERRRIRLTGVTGHAADANKKKSLRERLANKVHEVGEGIVGKKNEILDKLKKSYNTIEGEDGKVGLVDQDGNAADDNAREIQKERRDSAVQKLLDETRTTNKGLFGSMKDKVFETFSKAGGIAGSIMGSVGTGAGKVLGIVGTIAKIATVVAALGHFSQFWQDKIYPAIEKYIFPIGSKIMEGVKGFLKEKIPKFHDFLFGSDDGSVTGIFTKIKDFIYNPIESIANWYKSGWSKFQKNILDPLGDWLKEKVFPNLVDSLIGGIKSLFFGKDEEDSKDSKLALNNVTHEQKKDENGKLLYKDALTGEETTNARTYNSATNSYLDNTPIQDTSGAYTADYGNTFIERSIAGTNATQLKANVKDPLGRTYETIADDGRKGTFTTICKDTGEYIHIHTKAGKITSVGFGYICNNTFNSVKGSMERGAIQGMILGLALAGSITAIIATGGAAAPSVGCIAGALVKAGGAAWFGCKVGAPIGTFLGPKINTLVYELNDGNYSVEVEVPPSSELAEMYLTAFGWSKTVTGIDTWPDWSEQKDQSTTVVSNERKSTKSTYGKKTIVTASVNTTDTSKTLVEQRKTVINETKGSVSKGTYKITEPTGERTTYHIVEGWEEINEDGDRVRRVIAVPDNCTAASYFALGADYVIKTAIADGTYKELSEIGFETPEWLDHPESARSRKGRNSLKHKGFARHLYQNDEKIRNTRFGNSTLGEAGCGPVAATNLLNTLGGRGPAPHATTPGDTGTSLLDSATEMATRYQTPDGGTTPQYFEDMLNSTGYGGKQTDSKSGILNAIKNGQPTVLLGKSTKEAGTPFGAGNHYINALGTDGDGNMIVEDPDLPESRSKYPIKDVMKDTITGVVSGARRKSAGFGRFYKSRLKFSGKRRSGKDGEMQISKMAERAYAIIHSHEGNYESINHNDNGAISIGKVQWHGNRARNLIGLIIDNTGAEKSIQMLGEDLYNEIMSGKDWKYRVLTTIQDKKVAAFISTDIGKTCQDYQALKDIEGYIASGKKLGLTQENALVFYCDMYNQSPKAANRVVNACIQAKGSGSQVTAQDLYNQCAVDQTFSKYMKRRGTVLAQVTGSEPVGNGTTTLDFSSLHADVMSSSDALSIDVDDQDSLFGMLSSAFGQIARYLWGDAIFGSLFGTNNSSEIDYSQTVYGDTIYGTGAYTATPTEDIKDIKSYNTPSYRRQLIERMKSISNADDGYKTGKIKYSLTAPQDPDKGTASCASTVAWAYKKAVGYRPGGSGYASSTAMAKDPNLQTIWERQSTGNFTQDQLLKPGDILFYNWNNPGKFNGQLSHTEMVGANIGTNPEIWNNGGEPPKGPVLRHMNEWKRRSHLALVKRLVPFYQYDTGEGNVRANLRGRDGATYQAQEFKDDETAALSGSGRKKSGGVRKARAGQARVADGVSASTRNLIKQYGYTSATGKVPSSSMASSIAEANSNLEYAQFLSLIIDLLASIADNTTCLNQLQQSLMQKGVNISSAELQTAAANARKRQEQDKPAGKKRVNKGKDVAKNRTPTNSFLDTSNLSDFSQSPTGYIVKAMELLAQE